jgi:hypothetical protein
VKSIRCYEGLNPDLDFEIPFPYNNKQYMDKYALLDYNEKSSLDSNPVNPSSDDKVPDEYPYVAPDSPDASIPFAGALDYVETPDSAPESTDSFVPPDYTPAIISGPNTDPFLYYSVKQGPMIPNLSDSDYSSFCRE